MQDYGFVYRWDNLINGKSYIGSHKGFADDGYIGSGGAFRRAWAVYDEDCWTRTILYRGTEFRSQETFWIVKENAVQSNMFYNLSHILPGFCEHSDETKMKISEYAANMTPEHKAKLSQAATGSNNSMFGHNFSTAHRDKLGAVHENAELLTCPHCGKAIKNSAGGYTKWHGDNCKLNPDGPRYSPKITVKRVMSDETKRKLSVARAGVPLKNKRTTDHAAKIGKAMSEQIICPHCGKTGSKGPMKQWHFDNCKSRHTP